MKKLFRTGLMAGIALTGALSFTSCDKDDNNDPTPDIPTESDGVYVLNQGNYSGVPGMLSYIDYDSRTVFNNVFTGANSGQQLGDMPQCGIVYDDKVFLGIYGSNLIWVLDDDNRVLGKLQLPGEANSGPRSMVANGGYVYVALYSGSVIKVNATTFEIEDTVAVGPNPETMCIYDGYIYVPNSDGMSTTGFGTTATKINLADFTKAGDITVPLNPSKFMTAAGKLYLLCMGDYGNVPAAVYEVSGDQCKEVMKATIADAAGNYIYAANYPFNDGNIKETRKYDAATGTLSNWVIDEVSYPQAIGADPVSGNVFVASYVMSGPYPSYTAPGFVCQYSSTGAFVKKYDIGSGPAAFFFDLDD